MFTSYLLADQPLKSVIGTTMVAVLHAPHACYHTYINRTRSRSAKCDVGAEESRMTLV